MSGVWSRIVSVVETAFAPSGSASGDGHSQTRDTLIPEETRDPKALEEARKREEIKQQLRAAIAKLQTQEAELTRAHEMHDRDALRLRAAGRANEAKMAYRRAHICQSRLAKNRSNQWAAENRLHDIDSLEVDGALVSALHGTSTYMQEKKKQAVRPDQVQDIMLDLTEHQAEQEMVSEIIATATDLGEDAAEEDFETWMQSVEPPPPGKKQDYARLADSPPKERRKDKGKKKEDQLRAIADEM
jgi:hypothetical protein